MKQIKTEEVKDACLKYLCFTLRKIFLDTSSLINIQI